MFPAQVSDELFQQSRLNTRQGPRCYGDVVIPACNQGIVRRVQYRPQFTAEGGGMILKEPGWYIHSSIMTPANHSSNVSALAAVPASLCSHEPSKYLLATLDSIVSQPSYVVRRAHHNCIAWYGILNVLRWLTKFLCNTIASQGLDIAGMPRSAIRRSALLT